MTAKGIYYTQQDKIPEVAYTIARGIGGLLIVGSIIAVGLVGPLALAGAGAGAFLAFKITNMKPRIRHYGCIFKGSGEISVFGKLCGMEIMEIPYSGGNTLSYLASQRNINVYLVISRERYRNIK